MARNMLKRVLSHIVAFRAKKMIKEYKGELLENQEEFLIQSWEKNLKEWNKKCKIYPPSLEELLNRETRKEIILGKALIKKVVHTSGTGGSPKKVVLTPKDAVRTICQLTLCMDYIKREGFDILKRVKRALVVYTAPDVASYTYAATMKLMGDIFKVKVDSVQIDQLSKIEGRSYDFIVTLATFYRKVLSKVRLREDGLILHIGEPLKTHHISLLSSMIKGNFYITDFYGSTEGGMFAVWFGSPEDFKGVTDKFILSILSALVVESDKKYLPFRNCKGKILVTPFWEKTYAVNFPIGDIIEVVRKGGYSYITRVTREVERIIETRIGKMSYSPVNRLGSLPFPEDFFERVLGKYGRYIVIGDSTTKEIMVYLPSGINEKKVLAEIIDFSRRYENFSFFEKYYKEGDISVKIISNSELLNEIEDEILRGMRSKQPKIFRVWVIWEK